MRRADVGLFVLVLAACHANGRPQAEADCMTAPYTAWALARHGSIDLRPYPEMAPYVGTHVRELHDGRWVGFRPPGVPVTALPVFLPVALARDAPPRLVDMNHLGKLAAALCVAASAVLFAGVCRAWVPAAERPAAVLFAFGTSLWSVAGQALWMHGPATFWLTLALWLLARRPGLVAVAGFALGMATLCRPTAGLFAAATGLALLISGRWRAAAWLTLGGVGPAAALVGWNALLFGSPTLGGYAADDWQTTPPLWLGLGGLLVAPSRGVFVYSPALLVAVAGLVRVLRRRGLDGGPRVLVLAWAGAAAATVVMYARWHDWRGGWCFGPRFLTETMPVSCLLFAVGYAVLGAWGRRLAVGLVAVSVLVQAAGVFGTRGYVPWHLRHDRPDGGRSLFEIEDTQIEAHARAAAEDLAKRLGRK
jgi:hypothetical protein